ncbi:hypothetical protein O181_026885 [Austropuccinia psidii MF-1]|uniref:Uncharacterized protein n=1 Tax=Austropuccinia psidii MF-1 TaxID=1389203 RepID=A0A9Q3CQ32_9BASI|nr:hypothetical protein [Austropuccinia psidii MF-1]
MHRTKPTKPPQQDSPVPCMPCEQTLQQPTPGPSGTQWLEDLSREPSQHNEPPIPGPSPSSKPPEDDLTSCPATPRSMIIIDDKPFGSALPASATFPSCDPSLHSYPGSFPLTPTTPPTPPSRCQAPLIPTMTLAKSLPTYDQL